MIMQGLNSLTNHIKGPLKYWLSSSGIISVESMWRNIEENIKLMGKYLIFKI
jgi:hypothetical protein